MQRGLCSIERSGDGRRTTGNVRSSRAHAPTVARLMSVWASSGASVYAPRNANSTTIGRAPSAGTDTATSSIWNSTSGLCFMLILK